ncbi:SDR family oxidoreductase [Pelagicoccus mobilis]|uniref:SDR family oxidoreductase n=1 Tax=Pelagicoccus mobilis TaxID=415221 RepID=A0A934S3L9_9BACT|nr:SDR family oxidoreductase [Pelagicoccus mobilis]MBK1880066.1 SDR family oxidoreductase [Pelagicoccus mobilis]
MISPCPKILVTGANRGIGLEFVRHYLTQGCDVIATCRKPDEARDLNALMETYTDSLQIEELDLGSDSSIESFYRRLAECGVALDLLISNAGVSDNEPFGEWSRRSLELNLEVNTIGPALLAQALAPLLKEGSKLIQLSTGWASMSYNGDNKGPYDAYAISKAGLNMLTHRLAAHLRERGITVVSLSPGWVRTQMGGEAAPLSPAEGVAQMTATIADLSLEDTGAFLSPEGEPLPR